MTNKILIIIKLIKLKLIKIILMLLYCFSIYIGFLCQTT